MNNDILIRLEHYINTYDDVNAKLLHAIIYKSPCMIKTSEIDRIQPFLLLELKNEAAAQDALAVLKKELMVVDAKSFQFIYLKDKLNLLSDNDRTDILVQCLPHFSSYELLHKTVSLHTAYFILFFVEHIQEVKDNAHYLAILKGLLPALIIHCAKAYKLIEFSVLVEACACLKSHFSPSFIYQTLQFIEDLQTTKGNFGLSDPFSTKTNSKDDVFLVSAHVTLAYMKLQAA